MHCGKGLVAAALLVLTTAAGAAAEPFEAHRVSVRIYDRAGLDGPTLSRALRTAQTTLAAASVAVEWEECVGSAPTAGCDVPVSGQYVVRILRTVTQPMLGPQPLGDTLLDMVTGSAVLATIYFQRVHRLAQSAGADDAEVLGYAIAHELGHLLLASRDHSVHGLMRPLWRERELRQRRESDWRFTAQDAAAIRDRTEAARLSADIIWKTR